MEETKVERQENEYLGHTMTPDGWREMRWRDGKETEIDPLDDQQLPPLKPLHKKFRPKHNETLVAFMEAVKQVKAIDRKTPILREELIDKMNFDKRVIKDLIEFGLLEQHVLPMNRGSVKMGGRAVIIPTLEARKLTKAVDEALKDVVETTGTKVEQEPAEAQRNDGSEQAIAGDGTAEA
jgi:hypothetical protein